MSDILDRLTILLRALQYMPGLRLGLLFGSALLIGLAAGRIYRRLCRRHPTLPRPFHRPGRGPGMARGP